MFYKNSSLRKVVFPRNSRLTKIGARAFSRTALERFEAPDSLRVIEQEAFARCDSLHTVSLSCNVTDI